MRVNLLNVARYPSRSLVAVAFAMSVASGVASADDRATTAGSVQYSIESLYSRLVLDQRSNAAAFETVLDAHGVAGVTGQIGEMSTAPNGDLHVWLRHAEHGELVGRFRVPSVHIHDQPAMTVGAPVTLLCTGVYRSYAQVSARSCTTSATKRNWIEEKCYRYGQAWADLLARRGRAGLSQDFIDQHSAFVDGGCTAKADVCPSTERDLEFANILTIRAMNAGTASSFLPFACRR
jgi:hypothetical protein